MRLLASYVTITSRRLIWRRSLASDAGTTQSSRPSSGAKSPKASKTLSLLDGSPHSPRCTQTYLSWRNLGAPLSPQPLCGRGSQGRRLRGGGSLGAPPPEDPSDSSRSLQAACSTVSATNPRLLKSATWEPSGRLRLDTSGSKCMWYPGGRCKYNSLCLPGGFIVSRYQLVDGSASPMWGIFSYAT